MTFTVNADKTIIVNGTAINDATFFLTIDITKFFDKSDSIKIVGCPSGGSKTKFDMRVFVNKHIFILYALSTPTEIDLVKEEITAFKALSTYYPKTYINAESEQLSAYTMFSYPVSMEKGWGYVKQQIGDTCKYVYDMDTKLTETEVSTLEAKIDTAILSEMLGG